MRFRNLAGACALLLAWTADAQNVGSPEQRSEVDVLKQQVDELERRIKLLEEKFEKPMTVKAPFTVADAAGNPVLRVSNTNGRSIMLGPDGSPSFKVVEEPDGVLLNMQMGNAHAGMKAYKSGESVIAASNAGLRARLTVSPGAGVAAEIIDGNNRAQIGTLQGNPRVKLWKADKPVVLLEAGATTSLKLGDLTSPGFLVEDGPDQAQLKLARSEARLSVVAGASQGASFHLVGDGGHRVAMNAHTSGTIISAEDSSDDYIQMSTLPARGPGLSVMRSGKLAANLGAPEGRNTGLRIYDQAGELALQAGLGSGKEELVSVALFKGDNEVAKLFSSFAGEGALEIFRPDGRVAAQLGRVEDGKATALRIYDNTGQLAVGAGVDADNKPAVRVASNGKPIANMSADEQGRGRMDILESGRPIASLRADDKGQAALALSNKAGTAAAVLGVRNDAGSLDLYQGAGKLAAQLGPASGKNTALRVFGSSDAPVAAIGIDAEGNGAVRVGNSAGETVASMQAGKDGGGVYALDGTNPVAGIVSEGDRGIIAVYNDSTPVAFMTRSSGGDGGNITTALNNGFGVFSAGAAQDGAGEACINRKTQAGTARLACLGLGLPSAGMGK